MSAPNIFRGPYTWTPESGDPLQNSQIDGTQFEASLMYNLAEYLSGYFNGAEHSLFAGQRTFTFQKLNIRFQQGQMPQPLEGACIRTVLANSGTGKQTQFGNLWRTQQTIGLEFWVTANIKAPTPDGWNSDQTCRDASDCLYALLLDRGASIPLQANGFRRIRPSNPAIVQDVMYSTRRIRCMMDVWFDSAASNPVDSLLGGDN